ncbi:MAG: hypothetical protein U0Q15_01455 [Kineosporiaceae bacterium]
MVIPVLGPLRRSLIVRADGTRDTTTAVTWLQGPTLYVDLRLPAGDPHAVIEGFAGRFTVDGDRALWTRAIDVHPAGPDPDEGRLYPHPDLPGVLVEDGVHDPYVEHWHLPHATPAPPAGALVAVDDAGHLAVVVRVGSDVGVAVQTFEGAVVALGEVDGPDGGRWVLRAATDAGLAGTVLSPRTDGCTLHLDLPAPLAASWRITETEGDPIAVPPL